MLAQCLLVERAAVILPSTQQSCGRVRNCPFEVRRIGSGCLQFPMFPASPPCGRFSLAQAEIYCWGPPECGRDRLVFSRELAAPSPVLQFMSQGAPRSVAMPR